MKTNRLFIKHFQFFARDFLHRGSPKPVTAAQASIALDYCNTEAKMYQSAQKTTRCQRSYTLDSLRQMIGVVPQKASLVSGTIAENLRWGDAAADDAELEHACKIAQAWEFVSQTSRGLETKVTQGGRSLSGGQKQRLTIARALVGHPKLLILDDSMSALDYATDLELRRQLAAEMGDVTKIMYFLGYILRRVGRKHRASGLKNSVSFIITFIYIMYPILIPPFCCFFYIYNMLNFFRKSTKKEIPWRDFLA